MFYCRLTDFEKCWEAPILNLVHHSLAPLDTIVLQAYQMLLTKMVPGEKVVFSVVRIVLHVNI